MQENRVNRKNLRKFLLAGKSKTFWKSFEAIGTLFKFFKVHFYTMLLYSATFDVLLVDGKRVIVNR